MDTRRWDVGSGSFGCCVLGSGASTHRICPGFCPDFQSDCDLGNLELSGQHPGFFSFVCLFVLLFLKFQVSLDLK